MEYKQELLQSLNHTAKKMNRKKKHIHHNLAAGMYLVECGIVYKQYVMLCMHIKKVAQTHTF